MSFGTTKDATSLRQQAAEHAMAARHLVEKTDAAGRGLTAAEKTEFDQHYKQAMELRSKAETAAKDEDVTAQAKELAQQIGDPIGSGWATMGHTGLDHGSAWAKTAADAIQKTANARNVKALVTGTVDVPSVVEPEVIDIPRPPRRLIDVLVNRQPTASNAFEFIRQTARTNNAAPVPDGGLKPTSVFTTAAIEDRCRVVAHLSEAVPERLFADHAELVEFLDSEMGEGVLRALETQMISGNGIGENFTGIMNTSGTVAIPWATDLPTTIRKALTNRQALGESANAWLFNPTDLEAVDLLKDAQNRYYGEELNPLFGDIPKVYSTGVPVGTAILGDFTKTRMYVRQDMQIDADRSGARFERNEVVVRAEARVGLAVLRPQSFAIVDLTAV